MTYWLVCVRQTMRQRVPPKKGCRFWPPTNWGPSLNYARANFKHRRGPHRWGPEAIFLFVLGQKSVYAFVFVCACWRACPTNVVRGALQHVKHRSAPCDLLMCSWATKTCANGSPKKGPFFVPKIGTLLYKHNKGGHILGTRNGPGNGALNLSFVATKRRKRTVYIFGLVRVWRARLTNNCPRCFATC